MKMDKDGIITLKERTPAEKDLWYTTKIMELTQENKRLRNGIKAMYENSKHVSSLLLSEKVEYNGDNV